MPKKRELEEMLDGLVGNGLKYLERSARELQAEPNLSVVHFAAGVELILKARLFSEHWTLVEADPHNANWGAYRAGSHSSISARRLLEVLPVLCATPLGSARDAFEGVFNHRNRALHFLPTPDQEAVEAEQHRSWYHLHRLMSSKWNPVFAAYQTEIQSVDAAFHENTAFLDEKYLKLAEAGRFKGASSRHLLVECMVCNHQSGILDASAAHFSNLECPVCRFAGEVAQFGCGRWYDYSDGLYDEVRCECGESHAPDDLARMIDERPPLSPKEEATHGDPRLHCGECFQQHTVVSYDGQLYCAGCRSGFDLDDACSCANCAERWAGYNCESTRFTGCELCEGLAGRFSSD